MRQGIELVAGVSGAFLFVAYVAGRLYLQAYFGVFNAEVRDLGYSVQDVMFLSWQTLLPAILVAFLFAAGSPWLRSLYLRFEDAGGDVSALQRLLEEFEERATQVAPRFEEAKRQAEQYGETPESRLELTAITQEQELLDKEISALRELTRQVDDDHAILHWSFPKTPLGRLLTQIGRMIDRFLPSSGYTTSIVTGAVVGIAVVSVSTILSSDDGWKTTTLDAGVTVAIGVSTVLTAWFGLRLLIFGQRLSGRGTVGVACLIAFVVLVLPLATGSMNAHADRNANDPGRGLQKVVLVANRQVAPDWKACGSEYSSPTLRILGKSSGLLILWNPEEPDSILQVPVDRLIRIESASSLVVHCP